MPTTLEKPGIDLTNVEGSMTNIIHNNANRLYSAQSVRELHSILNNIFEENNLDTPASRSLLLRVLQKRNLEQAFNAIFNSYLYGANMGRNKEKVGGKPKVFKIDEKLKKIVAEDIEKIEVETQDQGITIETDGEAVKVAIEPKYNGAECDEAELDYEFFSDLNPEIDIDDEIPVEETEDETVEEGLFGLGKKKTNNTARSNNPREDLDGKWVILAVHPKTGEYSYIQGVGATLFKSKDAAERRAKEEDEESKRQVNSPMAKGKNWLPVKHIVVPAKKADSTVGVIPDRYFESVNREDVEEGLFDKSKENHARNKDKEIATAGKYAIYSNGQKYQVRPINNAEGWESPWVRTFKEAERHLLSQLNDYEKDIYLDSQKHQTGHDNYSDRDVVIITKNENDTKWSYVNGYPPIPAGPKCNYASVVQKLSKKHKHRDYNYVPYAKAKSLVGTHYSEDGDFKGTRESLDTGIEEGIFNRNKYDASGDFIGVVKSTNRAAKKYAYCTAPGDEDKVGLQVQKLVNKQIEPMGWLFSVLPISKAEKLVGEPYSKGDEKHWLGELRNEFESVAKESPVEEGLFNKKNKETSDIDAKATKNAKSIKESRDINPDIWNAIGRKFDYVIAERAAEVLENLADRALMQDNVEDTYEAVISAIDDGLFNCADIWEINALYDECELSDNAYSCLIEDLVGIVNMVQNGELDESFKLTEKLDFKYIKALKDKIAVCYSREDLEEIGADLTEIDDAAIERILNNEVTEADIEKMFGQYDFVDDDFPELTESKNLTCNDAEMYLARAMHDMFVNGCTYEEIADRLGAPVELINSLIGPESYDESLKESYDALDVYSTYEIKDIKTGKVIKKIHSTNQDPDDSSTWFDDEDIVNEYADEGIQITRYDYDNGLLDTSKVLYPEENEDLGENLTESSSINSNKYYMQILAWTKNDFEAYTDEDDTTPDIDPYSYEGSLNAIIDKLNFISNNVEFSFIYIYDDNEHCVFSATDANSIEGTVEIETNEVITPDTAFLKQLVADASNTSQDWTSLLEQADGLLDDLIYDSGNEDYDDGDGYWMSDDTWCFRKLYHGALPDSSRLEKLCDEYSKKLPNVEFYFTDDEDISEIGYMTTSRISK